MRKCSIKSQQIVSMSLGLHDFLFYLIVSKQSPMAAKSVLDDFEKTIKYLSEVAGSLRYCDDPRLKQLGYRRMNFLAHRYFVLYRIVDDTVIVDSVFHTLQDYENRMI